MKTVLFQKNDKSKQEVQPFKIKCVNLKIVVLIILSFIFLPIKSIV